MIGATKRIRLEGLRHLSVMQLLAGEAYYLFTPMKGKNDCGEIGCTAAAGIGLET